MPIGLASVSPWATICRREAASARALDATFLRDSVADEGEARGAEGDELQRFLMFQQADEVSEVNSAERGRLPRYLL